MKSWKNKWNLLLKKSQLSENWSIKESFSVDLRRSLLDTHQSPWSCKIFKNLVYQNFPNSWTSQEVARKPRDNIVFLSYTSTLSHWIHLRGEHHQNTEHYLWCFGRKPQRLFEIFKKSWTVCVIGLTVGVLTCILKTVNRNDWCRLAIHDACNLNWINQSRVK